MIYSIEHYRTADGVDMFERWLDNLADEKIESRITSRLFRVQQGLFGDCKPLQQGVWELRIDYGPGYRIYYSLIGRRVVILLCGGDKRTQQGDIKRATAFLKDHKWRRGI